MSESLPAAERLLNLVIALVNTTGKMTKEQIRTSVAGYDRAPSTEAFERMFERDKETLRELGVPVVTVTGAAHADEQGYRVDPDAYELPPMQLSAAQLGILALAAEFWSDQVLQVDASRALTKLRVVGARPPEGEQLLGLAPRVHPAGPALGPLLDAAAARQAVRFTYRAASTGEVRDRTVEPWRLLASRGGWYLVGLDRGRGAPRVFRLSRIVGSVTSVGDKNAFAVPPDADARALLDSAQEAEARTAWLGVAPERAGALRARARPSTESPPTAPEGWDVLAVPYTRASDLADEIAAYTDAVVVLDPPELRESVVRRLREAVAMARRLGVTTDG
ncbi:WYL domain-containing protein [Isoptericola sp. b441]|uniref:WYL domain-containing protein n=1 Tax=Actinotalea lenta TaxID=3064654 RepID=A0ABT9DBS4_9CELL|nr:MULTISPECIES: WYL domain-containing protein [unclassified Isoptericola]MDO8107754.1 WYL domain-containing protein [Isoptericola sp. b441]MDO8120575.1 WYL domain-containing protein [Isoptericola sp. b490]